MIAQSESDPKRMLHWTFCPILGLIVIEGGTSLCAVLEEVDKDPKEDIAT